MTASAWDALKSGRAAQVAWLNTTGWVKGNIWGRINHRFGTPMLMDMLVGPKAQAVTDARDVLKAVALVSDDRMDQEFGEVAAELSDRKSSTSRYGEDFGVEKETARLLFLLVRAARPEHVWETGVADGVSSFVILNAMRRNGVGTLHSTDIRPNVGILVPETYRDNWELHLIDRRRPKASMVAYAQSLPPLEMFIHDSLHRRWWQTLELEAAAAKMVPGGLVASDDADSSFAFSDFCATRRLSATLLMDQRKFFGITRI